MTVQEASAVWGVSQSMILKRLHCGLIPYKVVRGTCGAKYEIEDGLSFEPYRQLPPMDKRPQTRLLQSIAAENYTPEEYIAFYSTTKSLRTIAKNLRMSTVMVRHIYDRLLASGRVYG